MKLPGHLIALSGGWALWKLASLRGAGFPTSLVFRLAAPELVAAADELLDAEGDLARAREAMFQALRNDYANLGDEARAAVGRARKRAARDKLPEHADVKGRADVEFDWMSAAISRRDRARGALAASFENARSETDRLLRELASNTAFREAVTWQNSGVIRRVLEPIRKTSSSGARPHLPPRDQELIANYLHRYCTKNDTIGFFGPVGWGRFEPTEEGFTARPGPSLLASRSVAFEQWPIDVLARKLSEMDGLRPWIAPRRFGFVRVEDKLAQSPLNGRHDLSLAQGIVLRRCDAERTANALADELCSESPDLFPTPATVYDALEFLRSKQLAAWTFEFGTTSSPERALRTRLEGIGDVALRDIALAKVQRLEARRESVAASRGDPDRLASELSELEKTFTEITGEAPTRHEGATYAARGIVVEDCRRDFELRIGPRVLEEVGPALALVLMSARWLTSEIARVYDVVFRKIHDDLARNAGSSGVRFSDFWFRSQRAVYGARDRPLDAVVEQLRDRWASILGRFEGVRRIERRSAELASRVSEAFESPRAGWASARHHSPDLMIAAKSAEAVARGEYLAVLGEIHVAMNTLTTNLFVGQHPAPHELLQALAADMPVPRVLLVPNKSSPLVSTIRIAQALVTPQDWDLETGIDASRFPASRVLRLGELDVEERAGDLVVRTVDGNVAIPLSEVMGQTLGDAIVDSLQFLPEAERTPRVTIDQLAVCRETWRPLPSSVAFAYEKSEAEAFLGARRWARSQGMPRFVFLRSPLEVKPIFVDFESPVAVRIAGKLVRKAREDAGGERRLAITEMLPDLADCWLEDAMGNHYTAEIRVVAVDPVAW